MIAATYISPLILALASFNVVTGAAINNQEVTPGPGLPTLKELGITSADLYKIGRPDSSVKSSSGDDSVKTSSIEARFEPRCGPVESAYTNVNDVIACYNYLKKLGNKNCVAPEHLGIVRFCGAGAAVISGQSLDSSGSSSYCRHVADAVLWSVDHCTRGDKSVAGFQAATGNGDLIVGSISKSATGVRPVVEDVKSLMSSYEPRGQGCSAASKADRTGSGLPQLHKIDETAQPGHKAK
ncbi:hypothetical protein V493_00875 [Pseudogymnoascus sp. VKM F-4281 (FW-2241)]|nr:hypothetical protein V493_00875 [Pseudogymnoascus sp. VKM F-4281 (FW-2241)]